MVNYGNGKIYKITGSNLIYYGSTTQPLNKRKDTHKSLYLNRRNCISKIIIEKGNWEIVLVENYSCENKEQLFSRERWWIENNECINKIMPITTKEEKKQQIKNWHEQHPNYNKEWEEAHKEERKQYNIEYKERKNEKQRERRRKQKENINIQKN